MKETVEKELVERRQYARFHIASLMGYAVVKRGWLPFPVMGNIVDISMGGVSFHYVARGKPRYKPSQLDILMTDGSLHLDRVPLETFSWDFEMETERSVGFTTRQCGVKFGNLTDGQKWALRHFIQFHTTADSEA
jgi:c-di-GMP-binding flagellar brake protein YcgR